MKKHLYCKDLTYGSIVSSEPFLIKESYESNGTIYAILSDRSGFIDASVKKSNTDAAQVLLKNSGGIVLVSGPVLIKNTDAGNVPEVRVRECIVAESFFPEEVYDGISEETAKKHIDEICHVMGMVQHAGYRQLLESCLTQDVLLKLAVYPATHDYYGKYRGGALVATCAITGIVGNCCTSYMKRGNGLTTTELNWDLLMTAALLHQYGKLIFFEESDPFKKSVAGLAMNYYPSLQSIIEKTVFQNNIPINELDMALLLNVLNVATSNKTGARAVTAEGIVLRHICHMYGELEYYQWVSANMEQEDDVPYIYNIRDKRHYFRLVGAEETMIE